LFYSQYDRLILAGRGRTTYREDTAVGQVLNIFSFVLPANAVLGTTSSTAFAFAEIRSVQLDRQSDLGLGFLFFTRLSRIDFAEVNHVNCLVGRFKTGGRQWTVVDRSHMVGNS
jgi:hypothetical protein